jgi:hypothetical protein
MIKAFSKSPKVPEVDPKISEMERSIKQNVEIMDGWLASTSEQFGIWAKRSTVISFVEAAIAIIATLQWGYDDLFHCWANGNGWQVCY